MNVKWDYWEGGWKTLVQLLLASKGSNPIQCPWTSSPIKCLWTKVPINHHITLVLHLFGPSKFLTNVWTATAPTKNKEAFHMKDSLWTEATYSIPSRPTAGFLQSMFEIFSYQTQERGGQKRKVINAIGLADQMYCRNDGVCGPKSLFLLDESISESGSGKGHTYNISRTKNFLSKLCRLWKSNII